jgi:hypothetical protein
MEVVSFLVRNVDESQPSEHTDMLQKWLPPLPGVIMSVTDYRSHWSADLEIDCH